MSSQPRILCLHGGGVTAHIFSLQMRYFKKTLETHFRLVFVDGPYLCEMHEDLKPVYGSLGTCRRWGRWLPHHPAIDSRTAQRDIENNISAAMEADEGTGEWAGLLGFSQGAKLAFSILLENQIRLDRDPDADGFAGVHWKFGVIFAGRSAPYSLSDATLGKECFDKPGELPIKEYPVPGFADRLRAPTVHVHGMKDQGLELHRKLLQDFCYPGSSKLMQWEGTHRLPFKSTDVKRASDLIIETAKAAQAI